MAYAIRITRTAKELEGLWERLDKGALRIIAYEHLDGARPHIHIYAEGVTVSTDTLKNWIKRALSVQTFDKKDWSFKVADGDLKIITYMSKGKYDPAYNKGFELEQVAKLKGTWLDYAGLLRTSPTKLVQPKLNVPALIDEIERRYMEIDRHTEDLDRIMTCIIDIAKKVVYKENKAIVGRHKFRDFVDTVFARVCPDYPWQKCQKDFMLYR